MVNEDAKTMINSRQSNKISTAEVSGAKINIAERYWARMIIGIL